MIFLFVDTRFFILEMLPAAVIVSAVSVLLTLGTNSTVLEAQSVQMAS